MQALLNEWCAPDDVSWEFNAWVLREPQHYVTSIDGESEWWAVFQGACEVCSSFAVDKLLYGDSHCRVHSPQAQGMQIETEIFPAATDCRFLRRAGIPSLGFSPMSRTPVLLHDHNESLHKDVFLRGIDIYANLLRALLSHC